MDTECNSVLTGKLYLKGIKAGIHRVAAETGIPSSREKQMGWTPATADMVKMILYGTLFFKMEPKWVKDVRKTTDQANWPHPPMKGAFSSPALFQIAVTGFYRLKLKRPEKSIRWYWFSGPLWALWVSHSKLSPRSNIQQLCSLTSPPFDSSLPQLGIHQPPQRAAPGSHRGHAHHDVHVVVHDVPPGMARWRRQRSATRAVAQQGDQRATAGPPFQAQGGHDGGHILQGLVGKGIVLVGKCVFPIKKMGVFCVEFIFNPKDGRVFGEWIWSDCDLALGWQEVC